MKQKPIKRRSSLEVSFDKRFKKLEMESALFLSVYFDIDIFTITNAGDKYKDVIMDCINKRELGQTVYNSTHVPINII